MPPYLQIPQTPSAKTQFEGQIDELSSSSISGSDRAFSDTNAHRPTSPFDRASDAEEIAKHRRKTASPAAPSLLPYGGNSNRLGPSDAFHRLSIGSFSDAGYGPTVSPLSYRATSPSAYGASSPATTTMTAMGTAPTFINRIWARNKAVLLVFFAQLFGALMNLFARLLELDKDDHAFHPVQLLFVRMIVTTVASCVYMWYYRVPHFPLGPLGVRWLLVVRGLTGFFGIFGMWYSMMYLPLAEATVFTFLTPSVSGYLCHVLLKEPFTRKEQIASVVAFIGIILITRPLSLVSSAVPLADQDPLDESAANMTALASGTVTAAIRDLANATVSAATDAAINAADSAGGVPTPKRLLAIAVALLGVFGGSSAFTAIRAIGTRAHPLISVNYFSTWCTIVSGAVLAFAPMLDIGQPYLRFALPHTFRQWAYLLVICVCGFCTQFMATMGLGIERSNRATAMVYTQMLFAAAFDRFVFGHEMGPISLTGCGLIIGSALWAALSKSPNPVKATAAVGGTGSETAPRTNSMADIEIGIIEPVEYHHRPSFDAADGRDEEGIPILAAEAGEEDEIDLLDQAERSS